MKIGTSTVTAIYLGTTSIVSAYLGATQVFGGASAFTPLDLFSGGSQGIWLDPSDLSTMFSDRAGTTPVTTPGTVVGLRLDKSKGLTLGAELVTNGDFSGGTTGWTSWQTGTLSIDTGRLKVENGAATISGGYQIVTVVVGKVYQFEGIKEAGTASGPRYYLGTSIGGTQYSSNAAASTKFTATSTTLVVTASTQTTTLGATAFFDNISVRELPGNHAVAPTDAARPTYGVEPKGGRRNLLLATDTLSTQSLTVTAVAHTLAFTGTGTVTLSGASIAGPLIGTGASDRVSLTFTPTAASLTLTVVGSVTLGQLELGSSATAYQKVVTAYNVTESGVATTHYVQFDGSDDSMSTAAINFTATDKMSVFAGVRKLSDAATGVVVELSATVASNNGSFLLAAPDGATATFGFDSKGTTQVDAVASSLTAPISRIVTGLADIAGDRATIRIDGVQADQDTGDQGTGNFGNYPLFIGRRNNATLPFNGRDFGIIVVGKAASAGEITDTETWLAARTSGVTL
jgi:hypothetical protein